MHRRPTVHRTVVIAFGLFASVSGVEAQLEDADRAVRAAASRARSLLSEHSFEGARQTLARLRDQLAADEKAKQAAYDQARARRRGTHPRLIALRRATEWLQTAEMVLRSMDFSLGRGVAFCADDLWPLSKIVGDEESVPPKPKLHLDPSAVLHASGQYVVWWADGSTRVPYTGNALPDRVWFGDQLRWRLKAEGMDGHAAMAAGAREIPIQAAAGEYEPFQIIVSPKPGSASLPIDKVVVADLVSDHGRLASGNLVINLVGYIWAEDLEGQTVAGPFADVLFPEGRFTTAEPGRNYSLWFTVHVPPSTPPGLYRSRVTLNIGGRDLRPISVALTVWDFELPRETHLATQLFSVQTMALCYYYGVAPWEGRAQALMMDWAENMARHRISLHQTPPYSRPQFETFPTPSDGRHGRGLRFHGQALQLASPQDHQFVDGFTVCFWLRAQAATDMPILAVQWHRRSSGHWVRLESRQIHAEIGHGNGKADPATSRVSADWPSDRSWHHVALQHGPGALRLFVDGKVVAEQKLTHIYSPAYGLADLGGEGADFDIDELRWAACALTTAEIAEEGASAQPKHATCRSYAFEDRRFDFASRIGKGSTEEQDRKWFWQWVEWSRERGLFLNNITRPTDASLLPQYVESYYRPLARKSLLSRSYVRLPHDESWHGPNGEHNLAWAERARALMPELPLHQTFGAMAWGQTSREQKLAGLKSFVGHLDVWSMVPLVMRTFWDEVLGRRVAAGDRISLYIHRAEVVEQPAVLPAARFFTRYLWKYDLDMCTYWATTLWSQPHKRGGKSDRRTWEVDRGFRTIKRNKSITAGTLFWPGRHRILNSLRAESWRDAIEDYEYLHLLNELHQRARRANIEGDAVEHAQELLDEVKDMTVYGRNFEGPPTTDPAWIYEHRRRVAEGIEAVRTALKNLRSNG